MSAPTGNHRGTRWFSHCARTRIRIQDFGTQGAAVGRRTGSRKWLRHMSPVNSSSLRICWRVATKSDESSPVEPKSAEIKSATPISNASSAGAATATGLETNAADPNASAAAQPAQPAQPAPVAADALAGCAAPCNQQPCPKDDANCLEGAPSPAKEHTRTGGSPAKPAGAAQAVRRAAIPQAADSERAETRASARQEERAQSSRRGKRAAQRETVDHQSVARRNAATVSRWRRAEDRASNWHRDRYDDYPRDGDRRFWAARDDDFLMGRAERHEGPLMMVPSARYRW